MSTTGSSAGADHSSSSNDRGSGASRRRRRRVVGGGAVVLLTIGGLAAVDVSRAPGAAAAGLDPFTGCEELRTWYADAAMEQVIAYGFEGQGGDMRVTAEAAESVGGADAAGAEAPAPAASDLGTAVGSGDTGTNVQEAGVDEPAALKTDGRYAYTVSGSRLVVADVAGSPTELGSIDLAAVAPGASLTELLLLGDRVVVLGSAWGAQEATVPGAADSLSMPYPGGGTSTTVVVTVDVSDRSAPVVVDSVEVDGDYVSARASGGSVRLVTTSRPAIALSYPYAPLSGEDPNDPGARLLGVDTALEQNREAVRSMTAEQWLPHLVRRGEDGTTTRTPAMACEDVSRPATAAGLGTVTVLTLDPTADAEGLVVDTDAVAADGDLVYASTDRLYVATTQGGWWWGPRADVRTDLHGFDTSTSGSTSYVASGGADGWLLGRWALSAQDGDLRVATTTEGARPATGPATDPQTDVAMPAPGPAAAPDTQSSVTVLRETGGTLEQVGRVDGLGPGEQIRAVRWFGDTAIVVTFRQTDPLYTVDLADPAAPRIVGELKVTGYSAYLHPLGGGLVLGVGQEASLEGMTLGTKVEVYDVSDLAAPTAVSDVVWEQSSSPAEWDSRMFAYLPDARTAVLPLERYAADRYDTGLVAVTVDQAGLLGDGGTWSAGEGGYVVSVAASGSTVLTVTDSYDQLTGTASRQLTVLDVAGLAPRGQLALGG